MTTCEVITRNFYLEGGSSRIQIIWDPAYRRMTAIHYGVGIATQAETQTDRLWHFAYEIRDKFALSSIVNQGDLVLFMRTMVSQTDFPAPAPVETEPEPPVENKPEPILHISDGETITITIKVN